MSMIPRAGRSDVGHDLVAAAAAVLPLAAGDPSRAMALALRCRGVTLVTDRFGPDRFYPTLGTAVSDYVESTGIDWTDWTQRKKAL